MPAQVTRDFHRVQSVLDAQFSHAISPSKTNVAGPVIHTCRARTVPADFQLAARQCDADVGVDAGRAGAAPQPPRRRRCRRRASRRRRAPTREGRSRARRSSTKPTLQPCGKRIGVLDLRTERFDRRRRRRRRLRPPRADCPSTRRRLRPRARRHRSGSDHAPPRPRAESRRGAKRGSPMSARTRPSSSSSIATGPDGLSKRTEPVAAAHRRARSQRATQRTPLPHCPAREPSVFQMP